MAGPSYLLSALPDPVAPVPSVALSYWRPHPKQEWAMACPADELFFGGAKGGGKSDWLLADFAQQAERYGYAANGVIFRRTQPEFTDLKQKAQIMYRGVASWREKDATWTWPNGAWLRMRYLDSERDVGRYQGHAYSWIGFDELTEWPMPTAYEFMFSCLRSAAGVPCRMRATGNPGRPGQGWVKQRFVDTVGPYKLFRDPVTGLTRVFVPAKLTDNPHLHENDPQYINRLLALSNKQLIKALRDGIWDVFVGQAFDEWNREIHVVNHRTRLDPTWPRWASLDWGYSSPFALLYFTASPNGHIYLYREAYGNAHYDDDAKYDESEDAATSRLRQHSEKFNEGARIAASRIAQKEFHFNINSGIRNLVVDYGINQQHGHDTTIGEQFKRVGWEIIEANKDRIAGKAAVHSWLQTIVPTTGRPILQVFDTCINTIRTLPALVYNTRKGNPEDVDTESEDHCYDALRYAAMCEMATAPSHTIQVGPQGSTMDDLNNVWEPNNYANTGY